MCLATESPLHAPTPRPGGQSLHLSKALEMVIPGHGALARAGCAREADGALRGLPAQQREDQRAGEAVAGADPVDDGDFVAAGEIRLAFVKEHRAPTGGIGRRAVALRECHGLEAEPAAELLRRLRRARPGAFRHL